MLRREKGSRSLQAECHTGSHTPSPGLSGGPLGSPALLPAWHRGDSGRGLGRLEDAGKADVTAKGETPIAGVWEMPQPLGVCKQWGGSPGDPLLRGGGQLCPIPAVGEFNAAP